MATYTIKQGDTLSSIAKKYNTTVDALASANGIANPNLIIAGNTLKLPSSNGNVGIDLTGGSSTNASSGYTYTPFTYDSFAESDETKGAYSSLTNASNDLKNLGDFNWVDEGKLNDYTSKYENRPDFSYDFNSDALYQQYKDKYIKQAKMASADVMGQAAAMTGGYGNSYAQTVGNQAYQANLGQLNDVIPELYQLAYDKYNQEGQDLLNMISLLRGERDFAYGQYNDEYNKLSNERDYWSSMYNNLYNRDYTQYTSDRTYNQTEHTNTENAKYNTYRDSVEDEQWQKTYEEGQRQYDESLAFQKQQYEDSKKEAALEDQSDDEKENKVPYSDKANSSGFTGTTFDDAYKYCLQNGVPMEGVGTIMRSSEWIRRKNSYKSSGKGGSEVKNYDSYKEYLAAITEYLVEQYN